MDPTTPASDAPGSSGEASAVLAEGLVRRFGATLALAGVGLQVGRGELYGLIGPDGAGKTTIIRALAGLIDIDAGRVAILGRDPHAGGGAVRESLGLMPQQYSLYRDLSVGENLRFFGRLYCLSRAEFRARSERLLEVTRLAPFVDRRADALSGGMYKKLALACALLHRPEVLLLDEPTNGVDPVSRRELWRLLHGFVAEGMTVLVSTPYMDEAERCHRVGLVHEGRMLLEGSPRALLAGFGDVAFEVHGGARDAVDEALRGLSPVRAASPAGSRLRIVVDRAGVEPVRAALGRLGAELAPARPGFEDLFLSEMARAEAAPGGEAAGAAAPGGSRAEDRP